jgi:acyl-CoA dehydrogenase
MCAWDLTRSLARKGAGLELAGKWLGMGRIWVGATCCGKAERIMDMATEWAATRKQFGQAIGKFQAFGFKLADMAIGVRTGDLLVIRCGQRVRSRHHERR